MKPPAPSFAYLFERFPSFVQTFCYREVEEMARQHMEPLVISIRHPEDPAELLEKLDAKVLYLPEEKVLRAEVDRLRGEGELPSAAHRAIPKHRGARDSQRLFEAVWLAPLLKEQGIRHVHAHFGGMAARTAWWLHRLYGIPYSFTGHANDIFCDTEFPISNADLVEDARLIITETDFAKTWMERKYPTARGKVERVFNGICLEGFAPRGAGFAARRILSVGRYVEKKGFTHLIEACRLLRSRGEKFECLIVGGGPLEAELQAQIVQAGLADAVQLLGPRPQEEVRQLLATASVFVLACVPEAGGGSDNLPTVIMEAMAAGIPIISTKIAGVPEMMEDSVEGLLVEPADPAALSEAIARILNHEELNRRMGEQGHETARSKFGIENTVRTLKLLLASRADLRIPEAARVEDPLLPEEPGFLRRFMSR